MYLNTSLNRDRLRYDGYYSFGRLCIIFNNIDFSLIITKNKQSNSLFQRYVITY